MFLKLSIVLVFQLLSQIDLGVSQAISAIWKPCPKFVTYYDKWVTYDGSTDCFLFSSYYPAVSWHEANDRCQARNGTLASIHSIQMNYNLSNRTQTSTDYDEHIFWIGMNSLTKRGAYKWSDGSPNEFEHYATVNSKGDAVPSSVLDQGRCVSMSSFPNRTTYPKTYQGQWFKDDCISKHRYICKRSINPVPTPTPPPAQTGGCPKDWFNYANQKCVKYFNVSMTFNQTRDLCVKTNNGEMLSIHSAQEQNFITAWTAGQPSPYIGFRTPRYYYTDWSWDASQKVDYTNWGVNTYRYYTERCATVVTNKTQPGKWVYGNCSDHHPIICEKPLDPSVTTTGLTYKSSKCKIAGLDNFIQYGNSCYAVFESNNRTFSEAETYCKSLKTHLVSIVNPFEEAFLQYYLKQYGSNDLYWIGFQSLLDSDTANATAVPQMFEWTDEWPVYYTNWDRMQPQFAGLPREECVTFSNSNGTWRTTFCDDPHSFVCKATTEDFPNKDADKSGVCPKLKGVTDKSLMWLNIDKRSPHCYWFSADRSGYYYYSGAIQSWTDASFDCRRRNGTLASIHSEHELMLLKSKFMNTSSSYNTWIGLSSDPNGDYTWEDGTAVDYTNWDQYEKIVSGNPDLTHVTKRTCVEVEKAGQTWKQEPCSGGDRNYYVCSVKKIYSTKVNSGGQKSGEKPKMSGGAKAGIAFGVIGGVLVLLVVGFFAMKKYRPNSPMVTSFPNSLYASRRFNGQANNHNEPGVSFNHSNSITN